MILLIRNVHVVSKGASEPRRADILVSGNKISGIGSFAEKQADVVIDGQGCYASSGFIDVHDASDHYLKFFEREAWDGALRNGVTTIIGGHEGVSLGSTLRKEGLPLFKPWSDARGLGFGWHTTKEFLNYTSGLKLPINIATFAGADSLMAGSDEKKYAGILTHALRDGAVGLSLDMAGADTKIFLTKDMQEFRDIVNRDKKIFSIRLDGRENIETQMKSIAAFFGKTDCRTVISCLALSSEAYKETYKLFKKYFSKQKNVFFDGGTSCKMRIFEIIAKNENCPK